MVYRYLYQDKENRNLEGEIKARDRAEAYTLLRRQGIRPYRVIGDDPWNWRPWAIGASYAVLVGAIVVLLVLLGAEVSSRSSAKAKAKLPAMSAEEARRFREMAEDAVARAPDAYRYNVWVGVNFRLKERGLEPIPRPEGLVEQ
ncbi:MAG: hypothetical protein K6G91_02445 [Kiritimatiellae bacterium]|nr:hypothetical protein [Kiritimatiellia bacterium]